MVQQRGEGETVAVETPLSSQVCFLRLLPTYSLQYDRFAAIPTVFF